MPLHHKSTSQEILNSSFDESYGVVGVIPMVENEAGTAVVRQKNIGKAEDSAHVSGDIGVPMWGVRVDAFPPDGGVFGADGDYTPIATNYKGDVKVIAQNVSGASVNVATEETQLQVKSAIENITIPAPVGGATSVNQETLNSLVETLQELNARLTVIAGMANAGAPALRTIPIASVSTAVTGTVTATVASTVVSSLTNFGTGIPASEMAHDINNYTAIIANINNVTP